MPRISPEVEWDVVCGTEGVGGAFGRTGIEIHVPKALIDGLTTDTRYEVSRLAEQALELICLDKARRDPTMIKTAAERRAKLIGMFSGLTYAWVEEIPNGYGLPHWYTIIDPWFKVYTNRGPITVGWRRRVINIDWSLIDQAADAAVVFPKEHRAGYPTTGNHYIHAYSYEDGYTYLHAIMDAFKEVD